MNRSVFAVFASLMILGAAAGSAFSQARLKAVALSDWGSRDARVSVEKEQTVIEFSCASGLIKGRLKVDKKGNFAADGTYTGRSHGPIRVGFEPKPEPVRYTGSIKGKTMILTIDFPNSERMSPSYELEKGKTDDRFVRCY